MRSRSFHTHSWRMSVVQHPSVLSKTLDDAMKICIEQIFDKGRRVVSSKGENIELIGVTVEIENPRARLSRSEMRGKLFSCLGELLWYLSGSNSVEQIEYYINNYKKCSEDGEVYGGYGPRLCNWNGLNQIQKISELLRSKPTSRKAVIQLFDRTDLLDSHKDIPCTCTLQFFI